MRLTLCSLAAAATVFLTGCGDDQSRRAAAPSSTPPATITCDEVAYAPKQSPHYVHPTQNFYAPDVKNAPTPDDLDHLLLNDNAVVVAYPARADQATQDRLAKWASEQVAAVVVPDKNQTAPVTAKIATANLTCDGLDTAQLSAFAAKRGTGSAAPHPDEG